MGGIEAGDSFRRTLQQIVIGGSWLALLLPLNVAKATTPAMMKIMNKTRTIIWNLEIFMWVRV